MTVTPTVALTRYLERVRVAALCERWAGWTLEVTESGRRGEVRSNATLCASARASSAAG